MFCVVSGLWLKSKDCEVFQVSTLFFWFAFDKGLCIPNPWQGALLKDIFKLYFKDRVNVLFLSVMLGL